MKERIIEKANKLGFGQISFIPIQPLPLWDEKIETYRALDANIADYLESRGIVSDCRAVMEDAETIIAAAFPYLPNNNFHQEQGYYSAHYEAYPKGRKAITELGNLLIEKGHKVAIDPPIPAKQIAYLSGLGKFGKNCLIHHSKFGSFLTLHIILTNAEIASDDIKIGKITDCGTCSLCIDACPMQAITEDGVILINRCLRFHMMSSGIIPIEVREKMDNRIVGCDECQIVCPKNRPIIQQCDNTYIRESIFNIKKLLADAKTGLKAHMDLIGKRIGKNYARTQRVLSMAVIIAGNSCDRSYLPLLADTLQHPHPPIRAHSAWAIGKLGGKSAKELLKKAQNQEINPDIKKEIDLAIQICKI
jgi:epoxyqueuosine reductase